MKLFRRQYFGLKERRLIQHDSYIGRTVDGFQDYVSNAHNQPGNLAALPTHVFDGASRVFTDVARLFQKNPRKINKLSHQGRFSDSLQGGVNDTLDGLGNTLRFRFDKAIPQLLSGGASLIDMGTGAIADAGDAMANVDSVRKRRETQFSQAA